MLVLAGQPPGKVTSKLVVRVPIPFFAKDCYVPILGVEAFCGRTRGVAFLVNIMNFPEMGIFHSNKHESSPGS